MIVRHDTRILDRVMAAGAANAEQPSQRARAVEATVTTMVDGQAAVERTRAAGEAYARRSAGNGRFAVLAGAGIAIAAVGIGLGIWLARPPVADVLVAETPAAVPPTIRAAVGEHADPATPVVTNFVLFRQVTVQRAGRNWVIEAGHQFDSAADTAWSKAWCYSTPSAAGVAYHLELADRASPDGPVALDGLSGELRQKLTLDDATFGELAAACPWLDGGSAAATKV